MEKETFFETEAGQFIANAHRYLSAARVLRYSEEGQRGQFLLLPTLNMLAHGIELLLKFPLLRLGQSQNEVAGRYGHRLDALWLLQENANLRSAVEASARRAWESARNDERWQHDDFSADPVAVIDKAVQDLARLHGRPSSFALRYAIQPNTLAPRPAFLIDSFGDVAERITMNPAYLDAPLLRGTQMQVHRNALQE